MPNDVFLVFESKVMVRMSSMEGLNGQMQGSITPTDDRNSWKFIIANADCVLR